ncbi:unnamed protein product [Adineta steineri]|uniref:Uncharacterized protein n=2 Tax=Adineta steineri TaxID=433720 RepID=A0A819A2Z3_9BILA|nr:unnamed protein product [Adineta steineri]
MCLPLVLGTTSDIVSPTYSGSLSSSSPIFVRPDKSSGHYYYQAIRVTVPTSGTYIFTSTSSKDTFGCFYSDPVDPSYPSQNLITTDDDGAGNNQFRISAALQSTRTYVLIVTTYDVNIIGSFVITVNGPASVVLSAFIPSTALGTTITGYLSSTNPVFCRPGGGSSGYFYYQAIQVTVSTSGRYSFISTDAMDSFGCLYSDSVDPSYPSQNLITTDDDGAGRGQFRINANLQYGRTYVLIVTTFNTNKMGVYTITVNGPSSVILSTFIPSTSRPITSTLTTSAGPSTSSGSLSSNSPVFVRPGQSSGRYYYQAIRVTISTSANSPASTISSYSGYLLSSSQSFARPDYSSAGYYYEAIRVTVHMSGRYSFTSISSYDTYGYLYNDPFNPSKPSRNLIASDDDSGNSNQFRINATLQSGNTYVLVFTTYSTGVTGSFSIAVTGPTMATLSSYTSSSASEWATWKTVCIVVPCVILFAGLISVCVYRQKQKAASNRGIRSAPRNQTMHPQMYPMTNVSRNISQPPYTISSPSMYPSHMEEEPPSYESLPPYFKAQYPPYST